MKILWHSTAPWSPSSYSVLTARTVPEIVRDGHNVAISVWYGLQGTPLPWNIWNADKSEIISKVTVFPTGDSNNFSQDLIVPLYRHLKADALILVSDIWPFDRRVTGQMNFVPWMPIDHDPVPEAVAGACESAIMPLVYSKWGTELLKEYHAEARYVPASANSKLFRPGSKTAARQALGITDDCEFLVTCVAANKDTMDRKGIVPALESFAKFAENHEGAYLYLHTRYDGTVNVKSLINALGITKRVIQPDPLGYRLGLLDEGYMVKAYQAADVTINLAKSEGFGLPILEAQMCGTPTIATDFSTTDELLWGGWKVGGRRDWSNGLNSWRMDVDRDQVVDALEEAYRERDNKTIRRDARRGAQSLDTARVFNKFWRPVFRDLEKLIAENQVRVPLEKPISMQEVA